MVQPALEEGVGGTCWRTDCPFWPCVCGQEGGDRGAHSGSLEVLAPHTWSLEEWPHLDVLGSSALSRSPGRAPALSWLRRVTGAPWGRPRHRLGPGQPTWAPRPGKATGRRPDPWPPSWPSVCSASLSPCDPPSSVPRGVAEGGSCHSRPPVTAAEGQQRTWPRSGPRAQKCL